MAEMLVFNPKTKKLKHGAMSEKKCAYASVLHAFGGIR